MEKLQFGETAVLENGKEYVCFSELELNGISYVYLVTNSAPLEVRFAKQIVKEEGIELTIVENPEEKQFLLESFKNRSK